MPAKETLRSNIRDYIQQQIAEGVYRPGDRIVETQLAKELGVSQAPVREAILELSTMGLLEEKPYSGTFVRQMEIPEILDIFDIRAFVEEYAAKRAAACVTDEQLSEMEQILQRMEQEENANIPTFVRLDMEFHGLVMDAAGSPALKRTWKVLRMAEWTYLCAAITGLSLDEMIEQRIETSSIIYRPMMRLVPALISSYISKALVTNWQSTFVATKSQQTTPLAVSIAKYFQCVLFGVLSLFFLWTGISFGRAGSSGCAMTPPYRQNFQKTSQPPAKGAVTFLTLSGGIDCWQLIAFLAAMRTFFSAN